MKVYILAATMLEIEPLIESPLIHDCKLIITGVGSVPTTFHLSKLISEDRPELVIQAGVAGSFDAALDLGTVVIVNQDRIADLGVEENNQWKDLVDLGLAKGNDDPYTNGWLTNEHPQLNKFGLPLVKGVTINEVTTNPVRVKMLKAKYEPSIESMEGAALHFVCLMEGIPFLQLRSVSNYVGERDKSKWEMKLAVKNLNEALANLIQELA